MTIRILTIALTLTTLTQPTIAQIIPDNTTPTTLTTEPNLDRITGQPLTPNATNLFHSFRDFSIEAGRTAQFELPNDTITTILTRITGTAPSQIDGTLIVDGAADLFFLNPNGISFGQDSRVNLGGDLILTTADRLQFGDNLSFSATDTTTDLALLSVLVPTGLQFGNSPGAIRNRSQTTGNSDLRQLNVNSIGAPLGINVAANQTLVVVGGDITLDGGHFSAIGGSMSLASLSPNTRITLTRSANRWELANLPSPSNGGRINLLNNSIIDASGRLPFTLGFDDTGGGGGKLQLFAQHLNLQDSGITSSSYGLPGETLTAISENLTISGTVQTGNTTRTAGIYNQPQRQAQGGDIYIQSQTLQLSGGSQISTFTVADGNAGSLVIDAEAIELTGIAPTIKIPTALDTVSRGRGDAGNLTIRTNTLSVRDGAAIRSSSFGGGAAGDIAISADEFVTVAGTFEPDRPESGIAEIMSASEFRGNTENQPSQLSIVTPLLTLDRYGRIQTRSLNRTPGGDLTLDIADRLTLSGGGNISIDTVNGGGRLTINTPNGLIEIRGTDINGQTPSGIFTQIQADGLLGAVAGNLEIHADQLIIRDGGAISVDTFGAGNAGQLILNARDLDVSGRSTIDLAAIPSNPEVSPVRVTIDRSEFLPSRISAFTAGDGAGGSLNLSGDQLTLRNFATIDSSSLQLEDLPDPNVELSPAGNIDLRFDRLTLDDNARIFANTLSGDSGNITINTADLWLDRRSRITTNATGNATGGNLRINTETLVALQNSDLTATAENNFGGRINLNATGIFGAAERNFDRAIANDSARIAELTRNNTTSDITASSALGPEFSGIVMIETPDIRADEGVTEPVTLAESPLTQSACDTKPGETPSSLRVVGRGGLPPNLEQLALENLDVIFAEAQNFSRSPTGTIQLAARWSPQFATCSW